MTIVEDCQLVYQTTQVVVIYNSIKALKYMHTFIPLYIILQLAKIILKNQIKLSLNRMLRTWHQA